jgi:hypothetical protein
MENIIQEQAVTTAPGKILHIEIPEDLHADLKSNAAIARTLYRDFVIAILRSGLEKPREKQARRAS